MDDIVCAFVILALLVCVALIYRNTYPSQLDGFLSSTFPLGSYDPSRYASDIIRRP